MSVNGEMGALSAEFDTAAPVVRPVYRLQIGAETVVLDPALAPGITLRLKGAARCRHCDAPIGPERNRDYCYTCFTTLARCDLCVMAPHRCHFHLGTCREPQWGEAFCMQDHVVYVANSSGPKIGISRATRFAQRWVDQGASEALVVAQTASRRSAGVIEEMCKLALPDRTDWRRLVNRSSPRYDLRQLAADLVRRFPRPGDATHDMLEPTERDTMQWLADPQPVCIEYPVVTYARPERLRIGPERPEFRGNLTGIIGRFLLFADGAFSVDDFAPGDVEVTVGPPFAAGELPESAQGSLF